MSSHRVRGLVSFAADPTQPGRRLRLDQREGDMPEVPASPALGVRLIWDPDDPQPVHIVAPDSHCTAVLLEHAAPLFPAEVVYESSWIVRLDPPTGGDWAHEVLSLVERWLEACRLPCAKVLYGGRSYLIRASTDVAWFRAAAESTCELSAQVPG
jgi:hypothetical protein